MLYANLKERKTKRLKLVTKGLLVQPCWWSWSACRGWNYLRSPESSAKSRRQSNNIGKEGRGKIGSSKTTRDRKKDEATSIRSKSRKHQNESNWSVCRACEGFHDTRISSQPGNRIQKTVDRNLKGDAILKIQEINQTLVKGKNQKGK